MSEEKKRPGQVAREKWHEFLDKNHPGCDPVHPPKEVIKEFHKSPQFEEIIAPLPLPNRVACCLKLGAFSKVKEIYEDCKKEQAYFPMALAIEGFMNKHKELFADEQVH